MLNDLAQLVNTKIVHKNLTKYLEKFYNF
jgi:hypothetical protein